MSEIETALLGALERIVDYYELRERDPNGSRFVDMEYQSRSRHEATMFGEARKVIASVRALHFPDDKTHE